MTEKSTISQSLVNKINQQIELGTAQPSCVWDTKTTGFGVRIGKTSATYFYKYRDKCGRSKTHTIGRTKNISVSEARQLLDEFKPTVKLGNMPESKKYAKFTVKEVCDKYIAEHQMRESTRVLDKSRINRHVLPIIGGIRLADLTAQDIMDLQNAIATGDKKIVIAGYKNPANPHSYIKVTGGTGCAKRVMEMLKTILNFAEDHDMIAENPMNTRKFKKIKHATKETAYLEPDGYINLGYALRQKELEQKDNDAQSVNVIKLLALTGCRKNELLGLTWDRVNFAQQYFSFAQTKTTDGQQNRIFGIAAKQLLEQMYAKRTNNFLFPSVTKAGTHRQDCLKALKEICKIKDNMGNLIMHHTNPSSNLTLHGLRHSFATRCNDLDFSDVQIEGLLGHKKGDVEGIYAHNRSEKLIERANTVSNEIQQLLNKGAEKAEQDYRNKKENCL